MSGSGAAPGAPLHASAPTHRRPFLDRAPAGLVLAAPLFTAAGFYSGAPLLLPVLAAAPAYAAMVMRLVRGDRRGAVAAMLAWALLLGATMTLLCAAAPARASAVVLNGNAYWAEMSPWLESGEGRESRPSEFIPQHLLHTGLFVALSIVTASALSILFGAILMDYMAFYVSHVVLAAPRHPVLAGLLGWHPWSVVRIAAFVILGVVLAEPLLDRIARRPGSWRGRAPWIAAAVAGLVLDIALKALLAPHWSSLLRSLR